MSDEYTDEKPIEEELSASPFGDESKSGEESGKQKVSRKGRLFRLMYNKFFLVFMLFLVWIMFFDSNNLISRYRIKAELHQLDQQKRYYLKEIAVNEETQDQLMNDLDKVERYGREKYLMKQDNEEIFLIIEE